MTWKGNQQLTNNLRRREKPATENQSHLKDSNGDCFACRNIHFIQIFHHGGLSKILVNH